MGKRQPLKDGDLVVFEHSSIVWWLDAAGEPAHAWVDAGTVGVVVNATPRFIEDVEDYERGGALDVSLGRIQMLVDGAMVWVSDHGGRIRGGRSIKRISRRSP
jgi:hypothetical protein